MFNIFGFLKKPFKKADDFREFVENKIAQGLRKIRSNEAVDKAEVVISNGVMDAAAAYFGKPIPADFRAKINEGVLKGCDIGNEVIVNQLEK